MTEPKRRPEPELASAAASTDPIVQHLLAERATAVANGDTAAVRTFDAKLAGLGYR